MLRGLLIAVVLAVVSPAAAQPAADTVRFAADAEKARGHLLVSEQLYMLGQARAAALHGAHPVQELGNRLFGPVRHVDAASAVFRRRVIAGLLEGVAEEYEESFKAGRITQVVEYQDAYGFFRRARALYDDLPPDARRADADMTALGKAFPSREPPKSPMAAKDVKALTQRIAAALSSAL